MSERDGCSEVWSSPHKVQQMSIQICRGCLSVNALTAVNPSLSQAFTQATGVLWNNFLPSVLCVQCKAVVMKCQTFRERAQRVNDVLMQLMITNDLNLTNINRIKRKQLRLKPMLERYPLNHCDIYHDADNELYDENYIKITEKENSEDLVFVLATQTTPIENETSNTQTELRQTFEELLKSPKREVCDTIDHDDILHKEVENASVIEDEEDVRVADVVDSIPMTDHVTDSSDSDSIADVPQENLTCSSAQQTTSIENETSNTQTELRKSLEDPLKSPKRELCDTIDHDDNLHKEVESASVIEDEEDVKVADVVDSIPMTDHVTDASDSDSIGYDPQENLTGMITRGATRHKNNLELCKNRKNNEKKYEKLKNEHRLVTESITESAPATSTVTETPSIPTNTSTVIRKEFVCDKCNLKFKYKATIIRHITKCYLSKIINVDVLNGTSKNIKYQMGNKPYVCNICNKQYSRLYHLQRHLRAHTGEKPFACYHCDFKSSFASSLVQHLRRFHKGQVCFACKYCDYKCSKSSDLKEHLKIHIEEKRIPCDLCDYKCKYRSSLKIHKRTHTGEKTYTCNICDYKCARLGNLKNHLKIHTNEKPFTCDMCDLKFKTRTTLKIHKQTHTGEKPYACNICDYKSSRPGDVQKHQRIHTGEKPFACDMCGKKFTANGGLNKHLRFHAGIKSHACQFCDYKCVLISTLKVHLRIHTGEKPFSCNICDRKCISQSLLKQHIRTHMGEKPYVCDICNKQFARQYHLQRHLRTHTGEKPLECNDCDFKCSHKSSLVQHFKRFHTGVEPYACKYCDYKCSNRSELMKHLRIHIKDNV